MCIRDSVYCTTFQYSLYSLYLEVGGVRKLCLPKDGMAFQCLVSMQAVGCGISLTEFCDRRACMYLRWTTNTETGFAGSWRLRTKENGKILAVNTYTYLPGMLISSAQILPIVLPYRYLLVGCACRILKNKRSVSGRESRKGRSHMTRMPCATLDVNRTCVGYLFLLFSSSVFPLAGLRRTLVCRGVVCFLSFCSSIRYIHDNIYLVCIYMYIFLYIYIYIYITSYVFVVAQ